MWTLVVPKGCQLVYKLYTLKSAQRAGYERTGVGYGLSKLFRQVSTNDQELSMMKAGLEDIVAATSAICDVNGQEGRLIYQGYDIHDLAEHSNYEEVVYLLWFGRLPNKEEYSSFCRELNACRALPHDVVKTMRLFPDSAFPMTVLRTVASMLAMYDPDVRDFSHPAHVRKAMRLTAQLPTIVAYWDNIRTGREILEPHTDLTIAANFLYLLNGKEPDNEAAKALDLAFVLQADHELNASTFAARVAASTLSNVHAAIVAAIGTLSGPLHGGANEQVMRMLIEIDKLDQAEPYIKKLFAEHKKVMGFGHRVYRTEDPRAQHLRRASRELGIRIGETKWYEIARKVEELVLAEKGLYVNVDFYSAPVCYMLGIPIDLFTPLFACSRMSGWSAHILEQFANNRLIRPRAEYTGSRNLKYVSLAQR